MSENWWQEGFFTEEVGKILFTEDRWKQAEEQVRFILETVKPEPGALVADVCCGTGRHCLALANRGLPVVGLDITSRYLEEAERRSHQITPQPAFINCDMRQLPLKSCFDLALNLYTSFGYFVKQTDNQQVISEIARILKPGGSFILELINRDYVLSHYIAKNWYMMDENTYLLEEREFDTLHTRMTNTWTVLRPPHEKLVYAFTTYIYSVHELVERLSQVGMDIEQVYSDFRGTPFKFDMPRMLLWAKKL